ncbi:MAG TPA: PEP-CTERM sorting domain-containing protein, partial [Roseiarcus sp.]|nr:PEP-CTERM sorting domain-containing protein [Roseiarcus sp.]
GPSGHYTTLANYQATLGGQPMTAAQQAYAHQEDKLRLLGYMSELGGDFALGQIFYHTAYGVAPPAPDLASGGNGGLPPSVTPGGLGDGGSDRVDTVSSVVDLVGSNGGDGGIISAPVPEPSTWAMMALGFVGFGVLGWRRSRRRLPTP